MNPADEQVAEVPSLAPPDAVVLDRLIDPATRTIVRLLPPHVELVDRLGARCELPAGTPAFRLTVATGIELAKYWIVDGELPTTCFRDGYEHPPTLRRAPYTVIGEWVTQRIEEQPFPVPSKWHDALASLPPKAPVWIASEDALLENLFGVATVRYTIALERLELAPNFYFAGRATATYAAPGDAAIVARRIKSGEVTLPVKAPEVADSFKRMRIKQNGPVVEIGFDLGMFGGIPASELQALAEKLPR